MDSRAVITLTLRLSPDTERRLQARAARRGQDLVQYIHALIERDISQGETPAPVPSPAGTAFKETGTPEEELR